MNTLPELHAKLAATRQAIADLEKLIRSNSEYDPARQAIARLKWRKEDLWFKIQNHIIAAIRPAA